MFLNKKSCLNYSMGYEACRISDPDKSFDRTVLLSFLRRDPGLPGERLKTDMTSI